MAPSDLPDAAEESDTERVGEEQALLCSDCGGSGERPLQSPYGGGSDE